MIIGVPKEIKDNENRVALTPSGASELKRSGHTVLVQKDAGAGSGFADAHYLKAGAQIIDSPAEIFEKAEMILKVKEPQPPELKMLREGQILFTYLHLAAEKAVTDALLERKVTGIAYETVSENGFLPLLAPMSEVAGRMSCLVAGYYLQKPHGGKGVLMSGVPGTKPAKVLIVGGGFVGMNAATVAYGMGADVTILEKGIPRIRVLKDLLPKATILVSNHAVLEDEIKTADAVIGAVLVPGAKAPKLITKEMVASMQPGSVIVDVAIDQGGCTETSRPTTHSKPVYTENGVIHYCVTNMPGAYPRTSTIALTNATLPYALLLAKSGTAAIKTNVPLKLGLNTYKGKLTCEGVAEAFGMEYVNPDKLL
ncbi:MAG: alanine dehydrogenase [Candidatus Burarchaeum sp.]|nr:alanine dehydrogenase [Candidatus Burarchaeum sp.]MDO8339554.1 alanine dehydrogenase [Candidatus Burarchaeum sp.]